MKKILSICLAAAAFVGCTNSDVEFDTPNEIGFVAAANGITRNVVADNVYPTELNMFVYSWTSDQTTGTPNYINGGEFKYRDAYKNINTESTATNNVWGGAATPYYWPNVKTLKFAGFSKSGNVTTANVNTKASYSVNGDKIAITDYTPGTGDNDLMYFPATTTAYGKDTPYVPVTMYHTCSWITFLVKGDDVTAGDYTVTALTINDIDKTANVECVGTNVTWSENTTQSEDYTVPVKGTGIVLSKDNALNVETNAAYALAAGGNVVVIPQTPGTLTLTYTYTSPAGQPIEEVKDNISLAVDAVDNEWAPGKHYIYTITIKANEILIAPSAQGWGDGINQNITIE